jgi:hypothetical protein
MNYSSMSMAQLKTLYIPIQLMANFPFHQCGSGSGNSPSLVLFLLFVLAPMAHR